MKITDIKIFGTVIERLQTPSQPHHWAFLQVETDEGITGVGEFSVDYPMEGSALAARALQLARADLIGQDPNDIERLWHKLYRRYQTIWARGIITTVISGIDIALWDIKGKVTGQPIYNLLGGPVRDRVVLYTHPRVGTPEEVAADSAEKVAEGFTALKTDPFWSEIHKRYEVWPSPQYLDGLLSPEGEEMGEVVIRAMREAVGPKVEILIDAHGNYNVPTAIRLAKRVAPYNITWFEEPCPPESYEALRQVRDAVNVPICVGERLFTRFDYVPIFQNRLADYIMPDVVWTGGISELKKIATMAEAYYIPISPHNAQGALQIIAGAHTMITVPNFYKLEFARNALEAYNAVINPPLDVRDGCLFLSDRPGLGVELNLDYIRAHPDPDFQ